MRRTRIKHMLSAFPRYSPSKRTFEIAGSCQTELAHRSKPPLQSIASLELTDKARGGRTHSVLALGSRHASAPAPMKCRSRRSSTNFRRSIHRRRRRVRPKLNGAPGLTEYAAVEGIQADGGVASSVCEDELPLDAFIVV